MLCSDSLAELTPQQVEDDRERRVPSAHRTGSMGWKHLGISPGGALKGMVRGYYTESSHSLVRNMSWHTHTLSSKRKHYWQTSAGKHRTFFLSSSTTHFLLNLKGRRSMDSSAEGCKAKKKEFVVLKIAKLLQYHFISGSLSFPDLLSV